jgi:hypothetical protein
MLIHIWNAAKQLYYIYRRYNNKRNGKSRLLVHYDTITSNYSFPRRDEILPEEAYVLWTIRRFKMLRMLLYIASSVFYLLV